MQVAVARGPKSSVNNNEMTPEDGQQAPDPASSGLSVQDRTAAVETRERRGLAEAFRSEGFTGESATINWSEFRAAAFTGTTATSARSRATCARGCGPTWVPVLRRLPQAALRERAQQERSGTIAGPARLPASFQSAAAWCPRGR